MPNATCIWLTSTQNFSLESDLATHFMSWLSSDELNRFNQYPRANQKKCFLLSRALLRKKLAQALNTTATNLQFLLSDKGKPYLAAPFNTLNFNLSHSGDWIALCISDADACGIDIEHPQKKRSTTPIANSYFHADEVQTLNALKENEQTGYFYKLWTLKEAFLKARGTGITEGLNKINLSFNNGTVIAKIDKSLKESENRWSFYTWEDPTANQTNPNKVYLSLALRNAKHTQPVLGYITANELSH